MTFYRNKLSANSSRYLCLVLFAVVVVVVVLVVGIVKLAALSLVFNLKYCWLVLANYSPLKLIIFHYLPEGTYHVGCVGGCAGHHFPIIIDSCGEIAGLAVIRGSCVRGSSTWLRCDTFAATPPTTLTIAAKTKLCFRCTNTHTHRHMQSSSYCASFAARKRSETDCPTAITRMHSLHAPLHPLSTLSARATIFTCMCVCMCVCVSVTAMGMRIRTGMGK